MIPTLLGGGVAVAHLLPHAGGARDIVELRFAAKAPSPRRRTSTRSAPVSVSTGRLEQFLTWMLGIVRLDFGTSMWTGPPSSRRSSSGPPELPLAVMATISPSSWPSAGVVAPQARHLGGLRRADLLDRRLATPSFWPYRVHSPAADRLKWLPPMVYTPFLVNPWQNMLQLIWPALPSATLLAVATRMTRSAMLEVLREDYIPRRAPRGSG